MKDLGRIYIGNHTIKPSADEIKYDLHTTLEEFAVKDEGISGSDENCQNTNDHYESWPEYNDERFNGCPVAYSQLKEARKNLILQSSKKINISKAIRSISSEMRDFLYYKLTICCGDPIAIINELHLHNRITKEIELQGAQAEFILHIKKEELTALGYDQNSSNPKIWEINEKRILETNYNELHHLYAEQKKELNNLQEEHQRLSEKNHLLFHEHEELKRKFASDLHTNNYHRSLPQLATLKHLSKIINIIPTGDPEKATNTKARRILSTVNSRTDLSNDTHHNFAQNFTLYNKSNNLMCTFIPKNGCSNLRYSFAIENGLIESKEEFNWIHSNNTTMKASNKELTSASINFIILRCPFARIASYFTDKILSSTDNVGDKSYALAKEMFTNAEDCSFTFEKFVNCLWDKPQLIQEDIHIKHQSDFLIMQDYDYWFDVTEFEELKRLLKKECDFNLYDTRSLTRHTSKGLTKTDDRYFGDVSTKELAKLKENQHTIPQFQNLYNDSLIEKIAILYISDLLLYTNKIKNIPKQSRLLINQSIQIL